MKLAVLSIRLKMKALDLVGKDDKHVAISSAKMMFKIKKKDIGKENPIGDRKMVLDLPFNTLNVGQSIWINLDNTTFAAASAARKSANRYSEIFPDMFCLIKHRGDARKAGYMWLEIGRVK